METLRLLSVQSRYSNKHLNVCSRRPCLPTSRLLLHRSLEKREANSLNKLHSILWLPVDVYIWVPRTFSFQVCSVSRTQLSLWSKWRPYLFLVFPLSYPCLLSITPWPFPDWLQLRPWISSSWNKVKLQCKNNKGKMNVLQSSMYSPQTSAFGVKLYLGLPPLKSYQLFIKNLGLVGKVRRKTYSSWFCLSLNKTGHILDPSVNQKLYSVCPVNC